MAKQSPIIEEHSVSPTNNLPVVNLKVGSLPSRSLSYPKNCEILYRPYTFGEIKKINQSKNASLKQQFDQVLTGIDCSFDKMELTVSDALYIGLLRKLSTLSKIRVRFRYKCNKCKNEPEYTMDSQDLEFDDLLSDYDDSSAQLPIVGEFSFGELEFVPLTLNNYYKMVDKGLEHDESAKIAYECNNKDFEEVFQLINNMSDHEDMILLDEIDKMIYHGLKPVKFRCKTKIGDDKVCDNSITVELDGGEALLLPFREREGNVKRRIRLGSKAKHQSN